MIGCIIQARTGSTRLPKKVLLNIDEKNTVLSFVIEQVKNSKKIEKIIVATTNLKEDDEIEELVIKLGVECFRGSETDVLDRYYNCAKQFKFDLIVRITSDCPLIDPQIIDKIIENFNSNIDDYVSNTLENSYPKGLDVEVFTFSSLEKSWRESTLPSHREHVTQYIRNSNYFRIKNFKNKQDFSGIRCTLDRKEDLEFIRQIIKRIKNRPITMKDIICVLNEEPDLIKINQNIDPNEGFNKSKMEDEIFKKQGRLEL